MKKQQRSNSNFFTELPRRLKWLFSKSGVLSLGFEHFLAMFPATILVPLTVGTDIIDISLVLFASGAGTLLFLFISRVILKVKMPAYLGSSFAYIGLTTYLIDINTKNGISPSDAYSYVAWSYIFSGALLVLLSWIYRQKGIERLMSKYLPPTVVGPAISLIGLGLADQAMVDSGFGLEGIEDTNAAMVALTTLIIIILCSLIKRKTLKNAAIIVGMVAGFAVYVMLNGLPEITVRAPGVIVFPKFHLPGLPPASSILGLFISVIPATLLVFTENIGRTTVINRMINSETSDTDLFTEKSISAFRSALKSHGFATMLTALIGSVPVTMYAENIAVMEIHKSKGKDDPDEFVKSLTDPFSPIPYIIAAVIAILFSFIGALQTLIRNIPTAIIGGIELFLFGIISAPGIQLLVEQRINYKKMSNQIITAAVLITGVSGFKLDFGIVELEGMGLGFVVGFVLNLIVQILKRLGVISDNVTFSELLGDCLATLSGTTSALRIRSIRTVGRAFNDLEVKDVHAVLSGTKSQINIDGDIVPSDYIIDAFEHSATYAVLGTADEELIRIRKTPNGLFIDLFNKYVDRSTVKKYLNDFPEATDEDNKYIIIAVERSIPMRKVLDLVRVCSNMIPADSQPTDTAE